MELFLFVLGIGMLTGVVFLAIYIMAQFDFCFTVVREGDIVIIVKSSGRRLENERISESSLSDIFISMTGYNFSPDNSWNILAVGTNVIDQNGNREMVRERRKNRLESLTGIRFFGLSPFRSVYHLEIDANSLGEDPTISLSSRVKREKRRVKSLRIKFNRPVFISKVELPGDNSGIDLIIRNVFRIKNPYKLVFIHKGDFGLLDEATDGAINLFCQQHKEQDADGKLSPLTYKSFIGMNKGFDSPFIKAIKGMNTNSANAPLGIEEQFGVILEDTFMVGFKADDNTLSIANSIRLAEQEKANAQAAINRAEGQAQAIKLVGDAEAGVIKSKGQAEADVAREILKAAKDVPGGVSFLNAKENQKAATGSRSAVYAPGGNVSTLASIPPLTTQSPPTNESGD